MDPDKQFDVLYGFENCRPEFAVKLTPETRWAWVVRMAGRLLPWRWW